MPEAYVRGEAFLPAPENKDAPYWCKLIMAPEDIDFDKPGLSVFVSDYLRPTSKLLMEPGMFLLVSAATTPRQFSRFPRAWNYRHVLVEAQDNKDGRLKLVKFDHDRMMRKIREVQKHRNFKIWDLPVYQRRKLLEDFSSMASVYCHLTMKGLLAPEPEKVIDTLVSEQPKRWIERTNPEKGKPTDAH